MSFVFGLPPSGCLQRSDLLWQWVCSEGAEAVALHAQRCWPLYHSFSRTYSGSGYCNLRASHSRETNQQTRECQLFSATNSNLSDFIDMNDILSEVLRFCELERKNKKFLNQVKQEFWAICIFKSLFSGLIYFSLSLEFLLQSIINIMKFSTMTVRTQNFANFFQS